MRASADTSGTMTEVSLVVDAKVTLSDCVVSLHLRRPDGRELPEWSAGSHLELTLPGGMKRQYSLCGCLQDRSRYTIAVLKEKASRGGSRFIHDTIAVGDVVRASIPRNNFAWLPAKNYIFIAGGIGITPLLPMLHEAQASGATWHLYYGGRHRSSMAFLADLAAFGAHVTVLPEDEHGLLDLRAILGAARDDTFIYCCGPAPLLDAVELFCEAWPTRVLQIERFKPKMTNDSGPALSFDVELRRSGMRLTVPPDKSILARIEQAGLIVASSCGEGVCGTCEVAVLQGDIDHRDSYLSEAAREAGRSIMICVSRSKDNLLVLDI